MSTQERDLLRSLTLGAPTRALKSKLVTIRDASLPRREEVEFDEQGTVKRTQKLGPKGEPLFDDQGEPLMVEVKRLRHPPKLKSDGTAVVVEVREPGLKVRAAIFKAAGVSSGETEKIDMAALQVETVVALTYVPGTNVKMFDEKDKPALMAQPTGGFCDDIFEVAYPLMNAAAEEEVRKN